MGGYHGAHNLFYGFAVVSPEQIVLDKDHFFFPIGYLLLFRVEDSMFKEVCSHAIRHTPNVFLLTQCNQLLAPCLV